MRAEGKIREQDRDGEIARAKDEPRAVQDGTCLCLERFDRGHSGVTVAASAFPR